MLPTHPLPHPSASFGRLRIPRMDGAPKMGLWLGHPLLEDLMIMRL
jgi:hypothetical protein